MLGKLIPTQSKRSEITQVVMEWVLFSLSLGVQLYLSRIQMPGSLRPPLSQAEADEKLIGQKPDELQRK